MVLEQPRLAEERRPGNPGALAPGAGIALVRGGFAAARVEPSAAGKRVRWIDAAAGGALERPPS